MTAEQTHPDPFHWRTDEIRSALDAVRQTIAEMGVETGAPAAA